MNIDKAWQQQPGSLYHSVGRRRPKIRAHADNPPILNPHVHYAEILARRYDSRPDNHGRGNHVSTLFHF